MMRKNVLLPALILAVGMGSCAAAGQKHEIHWREVEKAVSEAGLPGSSVSFDEIAIQMWVPDELKAAELTEDDREEGYIGYFMSEDEKAAAAVMYVDVGGTDLSSYKAMLEQDETVSGVDEGVLNGLACITYDIKEADASCAAFATQGGYILEFTFSPVSDEHYKMLFGVMLSSIRSIEVEETIE